jgi:hypothetical protein
MKSKKQFTVIWIGQYDDVKRQITDDPLNLNLVSYDTFGTYESRIDALHRIDVINRIYLRDGIEQAVRLLEH